MQLFLCYYFRDALSIIGNFEEYQTTFSDKIMQKCREIQGVHLLFIDTEALIITEN